MQEEEERKKNAEYIKLKEWEEKFEHEQKLKEQEELRREEKLRERELGKIKLEESKELEISVSTLEKFEIDKSSQN